MYEVEFLQQFSIAWNTTMQNFVGWALPTLQLITPAEIVMLRLSNLDRA
jgi:hypothetical protein